MTELIFYKNRKYLIENYPTSAWIAEISEKYSAVNVAYLKAALIAAEEQVVTETVKVTKEQEVVLNRLYIEKSSLFTQRAKLSNAMIAIHEDSSHNEKRKEISQQIAEVQHKIETSFLEIDYERGVRTRAAKVEDKKLTLSELLSRQKSIPVQKSRFNSKLKVEKDEAKQQILIKKVQDLENELITINASIKEIENK